MHDLCYNVATQRAYNYRSQPNNNSIIQYFNRLVDCAKKIEKYSQNPTKCAQQEMFLFIFLLWIFYNSLCVTLILNKALFEIHIFITFKYMVNKEKTAFAFIILILSRSWLNFIMKVLCKYSIHNCMLWLFDDYFRSSC